jgi:hypothetical protein
MKFTDLIDTRLKTLLEQTPVPADFTAPAPAAPAPIQAPAAEVPVQKALTPEGEVFLINLIKKALFMNPDDLGLNVLKNLPEINEKNASDVLKQIIKLMQIEAIDLDVNTSSEKA